MWFKRAGELVGELSAQKRAAAVATALAARATAEASTAKDEAAAAQAEVAAARAEAAAARVEAAAQLDRFVQLEERQRHADPEAEAALGAERDARRLAEEEAERQRQRASSLRSQLDELATALAEREREVHAARDHTEAVLSAVRSCAQLDLPSDVSAATALPRADDTPPQPAVPPRHASVATPPPPPAGNSPGVPDAALLATIDEVAPPDVLGVRAALGAMVQDVLGGELSRLVGDLRVSAVASAEAACDARVSVLENAVGELLGALDAETHRLLLKWKRQAEEAHKETSTLREQQRLQHIAHVDLQTALQRERRRANEAEERARAADAANAARHRGWHGAQPPPPVAPPPMVHTHTPSPPPQPVMHMQPPLVAGQLAAWAHPTMPPGHPAGYWVLPARPVA